MVLNGACVAFCLKKIPYEVGVGYSNVLEISTLPCRRDLLRCQPPLDQVPISFRI
jgi:hypothetical protein